MKSFRWLPLLLILLTVASLMAPFSQATLALSPGDIIVTDMYQSHAGAPGVFRQSPSGGAPAVIFQDPGTAGTPGSPYVNPTGVAIDSSGDIIVSDDGARSVFRQSPSGSTPILIFGGAPYVDPAGVAIDRSGDIIVADTGFPGVFRQSPSGGAPTAIFTGPPYANPAGDAIDSSGNIIVGDQATPGVFRQSPSGGAPAAIFTGPPYVNPTGVAIVPPSAGPVGGVVERVNKLTVFAPYLAVFGVVAAVAVVIVTDRKRGELTYHSVT